MDYNFSEHFELNNILNSLVTDVKSFTEKQLIKLKELNNISMTLSSCSDLNALLDLILTKAMELTLADGATIYIKDTKTRELKFVNVKNNSLDSKIVDGLKRDISALPLYDEDGEENLKLVAVTCALKGDIINIDDVYDVKDFDFQGTKTFDSFMNYRSKSMLVIPMKNTKNQIIGVLQLINKLDNNYMLSFDEEDEEFAKSLTSFAAIAIDRVRYEELLLSQSKMAAMGEMIDAIAHQWKQPLNIINLTVSNLEISHEIGTLDKESISHISNRVTSQIRHLDTTLNEFRSFFRPNKEKNSFNISDIVKSSILLTKDEIGKHDIDIVLKVSDSIEAYGFENEYKHILLNLINNSKDAFLENSKKIDKKVITIEAYYDVSKVVLEFSDNAGGIKEEIIPNIFEANFTTKELGKGSGIGLYMSKIIIDNMGGEISAQNTQNSFGAGVKFIIKLSRLF